MSEVVAADELRLLIERIERLEEEKKGISDDIKDVYSEAKARGFVLDSVRTPTRARAPARQIQCREVLVVGVQPLDRFRRRLRATTRNDAHWTRNARAHIDAAPSCPRAPASCRRST